LEGRTAVTDPLTEAPMRTASEIVRRVLGGEMSATEVLERHLAAIAEFNPRLNAIVTLCEEDARQAAAAADISPKPGPLQGVPFVVKDAITVGGVRATAGSLLLENFVPTRDASAVARLRQAGAVFIGKTNLPELALDPDTDNRVFGRTLNPLNETIIPGGSSGGDAAAVAAGMAPIGLGSDYGGSIRWPAQCTGVVGLRPTVGLVPLTGLLPFPPGEDLALPNSASAMSRLNTLGPLSRSAEDAWKVLEVIAGPDGLDPNTVPVPLGDPDAVDLAQLACAWSDGEGNHEVTSDLVEVVERAAGCLDSLGLSVKKLRPPGLERAAETFRDYRMSEGLPIHAALARGREDQLADTMRDWFASIAPDTLVAEYQLIAGRRDTIRAGVLEFMEDWPILLLPVSLVPPWQVGSHDFEVRFKNMAPCWAITVLGLPSLALPFGRTRDGLPVSLQVVGRPFADHEVIAIARALERTRPKPQ
jgi:Asp-tRNA(Asn)/Glu-tRNA(Gln) amidotransferase A subunit family amidase